MIRKLALFISVSALGFGAVFVLAAGGGGGGSVPPCTADTWNCSDWAACSSFGTQTRTCMLWVDCASVATPKPPEFQSCVPPGSIVPQPPLPPQTEQPPAPSPLPPACRADRWVCDGWTSACSAEGVQTRACRIATDCPGVNTASPATDRPCPKLQCGGKTALRERTLCRLELTPAGLTRELEIEYLPEECRALRAPGAKKSCIELYKAFGPCWYKGEGEERFACARNVLKLGPVLSDEVKACRGKTGEDQVACKIELKEKVFAMIKFRFYNLAERAEKMAKRGASREPIADFQTLVETKKQEFNAATSKEERRKLILDVRAAWREFVLQAKEQKESDLKILNASDF